MAGGKGVRANCPERFIQKVLLKDKEGKSLLENTLERHRLYAKSSKVNILTGFLHNDVVKEVEKYSEKYTNQLIEIKFNNEYEKGIINSLYNGIKDIEDSVVILNGDTYYSKETFNILNEIKESALIVLPKSEEYEDCIKIETSEEKIQRLGKNLEEFSHISIGCFYISKEDISLLKDILKEIVEKEDYQKMIWHNLVNLLIGKGRDVIIKEIKDHSHYEIDTEEDYEKFLRKN